MQSLTISLVKENMSWTISSDVDLYGLIAVVGQQPSHYSQDSKLIITLLFTHISRTQHVDLFILMKTAYDQYFLKVILTNQITKYVCYSLKSSYTQHNPS